MDAQQQQERMVEAMRMRIAEIEVTPDQLAQSPEVRRKAGINAELGNIALAGSVLESSYSQIDISIELLRGIFEKHGTEVSTNHYEIDIPDHQYLLVETFEENFTVETGGWTLMDTNLRKFPANKLRYIRGGSFGHHIDANLYAGGPGNTWVEIKTGHKLSLRNLPEGVGLEEFLGTSHED